MNYTTRIKQIEKKAEQGDGTVHIEVEHCFDRDIEPEYAEHRARQVLGIRPADEQVEQIYVVGPEIEAKFQDMTPEQAKKNTGGADNWGRDT
jgi:hypothetical protein